MSLGSHKIHPVLWFDNNLASEAASYYTSLFPHSHVIDETPVVVTFTLSGQIFSALNGGPAYKFGPAISFFITCEDQKEVDYFWDAFTKDGGKANRCGWVQDKYGVSWQVVPKILPELLGDKDKSKAERATVAMMKMGKLDIAALKAAHTGESKQD